MFAPRWATLFPLLLALIAVFVIRARWFSELSHAAPQNVTPAVVAVPEETPRQPTPEEPETPAEKQRRMFLGSWRDDYYGERTMTFANDGTGVMVIKLDSVGQAIYGEKLLFNLAWTIRDGVLEMKFTGGEPKTAVETISKLWGDTHLQAIEVLTETDLHLRSTDSQNLYTLKRLPADSP
jgi:hypothetical protein